MVRCSMGQQESPVLNAVSLQEFRQHESRKVEDMVWIEFERRGGVIDRRRTRVVLHATSSGRVSWIFCQYFGNVDETVQRVDGVLLIGAKAICDSMYGASGPLAFGGKWTAIEMMGIQEGMKRQNAILRWCHGEANLRDGLHKFCCKYGRANPCK